MGTHGRTSFDQFLHGSVAEQVVRRSRLPVLNCLRHILELKQFTGKLGKMCLHVHWGHAEELTPQVDKVHTSRCESCVQLVLDPNGVLREEEGMNVEVERYRCITQLLDSFGSRRLVIPFLTIVSPNEPMFEMA